MEQDELKLEGPGGVKAAFRGSQPLHFLLAILLGAWVWYLFYNHEAAAHEKTKAQLEATEKLAKAVEAQTKAIEVNNRTQKGVIYVLTMPQKEREKLNLVRPEVLYEMQGYRGR